ncbi:MAG TPA: hypothetical protein VG164_14200, partial [Trebonia sp.]|nr:hypothetical protein [Trebonia sp.]
MAQSTLPLETLTTLTTTGTFAPVRVLPHVEPAAPGGGAACAPAPEQAVRHVRLTQARLRQARPPPALASSNAYRFVLTGSRLSVAPSPRAYLSSGG